MEQIEITEMLMAAGEGDRDAEKALLDCLYEELRIQASRIVGSGDPSVGPTQLVLDAWMRIFRSESSPRFERRSAFFAYAATAMRNLLVDHLRRRSRGAEPRNDLDWVVDHYERISHTDLLDLHEAIDSLGDERQARVVELRFFVGMTVDEVAEAMNVSRSTVESDWRLARAKLFQKLREGE